MKLYVVQGNVYLENYGDYRNIFGVYDDKNLANSRVEEMKAELYSEEMKKNTRMQMLSNNYRIDR